MKRRVEYISGGIGFTFSWDELVKEPFEKGNIVEAFANADSLLNQEIELCLKLVYNYSITILDIVSELHFLRSSINFEGLNTAKILVSKKIMPQTTYEKLLKFKQARNLAVHSYEGEYALIIGNEEVEIKSQEDLEKAVIEESKKWIDIAFKLKNEITQIEDEIRKNTRENPDYYLTTEYYEESNRDKLFQRKYPKLGKKKNKSNVAKKEALLRA